MSSDNVSCTPSDTSALPEKDSQAIEFIFRPGGDGAAPSRSTLANPCVGSVKRARPGQDVLALTLRNGLSPDFTLYLSPDDGRDLFRSQIGGSPGRGEVETVQPSQVAVPDLARWAGLNDAGGDAARGDIADLVFHSLDVFDVKDSLAEWAADKIADRLDGQVNEGVYQLSPTSLGSLKSATPVACMTCAKSPDEPILVLIHGTFVDTVSTFGAWWTSHGGLVAGLFQRYQNRVYALDHRTLKASPIDNALTLARACPANARLHLVSHSRGGLVAEVLARVCGHQGELGDLTQDFPGQDYALYRAALTQLAQVVRERNIQVARLVRVACPAHGTLLASGRFSAYLSVMAWALEKLALPVLPQLVDFAKAVANERTKPESLPGVESMMPGRPLAKWLNRRDVTIPGELRVVAGDIQGDSLVSWIKVLLSDSFYWTDNDLVVNTNAMYGGTRRQGIASYLLERSGSTDHFHYFRNDSTALSIQQALLLNDPPGFQPIGPLSRDGLDVSGARGLFSEDRRIAEATERALKADGSRPLVLVLPGILGSNLKSPSGREWFAALKLFGLMDRIAWNPDANQISDDGPMASFYADLVDYLGSDHDVIGFGFDWRRPLEDEARRLANLVKAEITRRSASGQPVRVLAHSMGGVLFRVMQLVDDPAWQTLMQRPGTQVVMLGVPNGGSWAPMTILTGDDSFGATLTAVTGFPLGEQRMRQRAAEMPGLMQLQAGLLDQGLGQEATWRNYAERDWAAARLLYAWHLGQSDLSSSDKGAYKWAIPPQSILNQAVSLRRQLDAQGPVLQAVAGRLSVVLGQAAETPGGVCWQSDGTLAYVMESKGDGRVLWCNSLLAGCSSWFVAAKHGDLPQEASAFKLYRDLLTTGQGEARWAFADSNRGGPTPIKGLMPARPSRNATAFAGGSRGGAALRLEDVMQGFGVGSDAGATRRTPRRAPPLKLNVINGDVSFVKQPLLIGHSRSLELTGTESIVNRALGGVLETSLRLRNYPEALGQYQVFVNRHIPTDAPGEGPRPAAAVVVGLGSEGNLGFGQLRQAVRSAVLAWARHQWTESQRPTPASGIPAVSVSTALTAVLLGSGGSVSVSDSARALVRGVLDANSDLCQYGSDQRWPLVTELNVIDLYLDRATEAALALRGLAQELLGELEVAQSITPLNGGRARPLGLGYRGTSYDLLKISVVRRCSPVAGEQVSQRDVVLEYSLSSRRARSELRGKSTQPLLLDTMLQSAQSETRWDADMARSLFRLLVPLELQSHFCNDNALVLDLDQNGARYPWEMLDDDGQSGSPGADGLPMNVRRHGALLRKLQVAEFRSQPLDASGADRPLVIGVPRLDDPRYPELLGARREASSVAQVLNADLLLDGEPIDVIKAALARPRRIIHLAGHGEFNPETGGGMLMKAGTVLGPREFESMAVVPELVFINCCHLGHMQAPDAIPRHLFAASVAEQLIRNGVQCVVAAGWAVRDGPATAFAEAFYQTLLSGQTFQEAVEQGRLAAWRTDPGSNTWAAYQCYGYPEWRLLRQKGNDQANADKLAQIDEPIWGADDMVLALDEIRLDGPYRNDTRERLQRLLAFQSGRFDQVGRVQEAIAYALLSLGDKQSALDALDRAFAAADGSATLKAREQYLNLLSRRALDRSRELTDEERLAELQPVIIGFQELLAIGKTSERWALLGSAWKRLVMLQGSVQWPLSDALANMEHAYGEARALNPSNAFYPASQLLAAKLRRHWLDSAVPGPTASEITELNGLILAADTDRADFWSAVAAIELALFKALSSAELADNAKNLRRLFSALHDRYHQAHEWDSVYDNACFLLHPYQLWGEAQNAEKADAKRILDLLKGFAGR